MFIAILDLTTSVDDRSRALAQLDAERPAITAMPGCVNFRAFASHLDGTSVTALHEWADESDFRAYLASDAFARSGLVLRPMLTTAPLSRRFRAELIEAV